jgi:hypothetical protein
MVVYCENQEAHENKSVEKQIINFNAKIGNTVSTRV